MQSKCILAEVLFDGSEMVTIPDGLDGYTITKYGTFRYLPNTDMISYSIPLAPPYDIHFVRSSVHTADQDMADKMVNTLLVLGSLKDDVDYLGAGKISELPIEKTRLYAAAPNPFNPRTLIQYDLAAPTEVTLKVYNVRGRLVKTLAQGMQPRGRYQVVWLGDDDRGVSVASGVYFVRLEAAGQQMRQKVTLVR